MCCRAADIRAELQVTQSGDCSGRRCRQVEETWREETQNGHSVSCAAAILPSFRNFAPLSLDLLHFLLKISCPNSKVLLPTKDMIQQNNINNKTKYFYPLFTWLLRLCLAIWRLCWAAGTSVSTPRRRRSRGDAARSCRGWRSSRPWTPASTAACTYTPTSHSQISYVIMWYYTLLL